MGLSSLLIFVVAAVVTSVSALIAFPLLRRAGVVDVPSHRSSHTQATVRGGGVAVGCGITVATALVIVWNIMQHGVFGLGSIMVPIGFLVLTWCYSAIGMSDDLDSLQPTGPPGRAGRTRLGIQLLHRFVLHTGNRARPCLRHHRRHPGQRGELRRRPQRLCHHLVDRHRCVVRLRRHVDRRERHHAPLPGSGREPQQDSCRSTSVVRGPSWATREAMESVQQSSPSRCGCSYQACRSSSSLRP